jgi:hypothetical protein
MTKSPTLSSPLHIKLRLNHFTPQILLTLLFFTHLNSYTVMDSSKNNDLFGPGNGIGASDFDMIALPVPPSSKHESHCWLHSNDLAARQHREVRRAMKQQLGFREPKWLQQAHSCNCTDGRLQLTGAVSQQAETDIDMNAADCKSK